MKVLIFYNATQTYTNTVYEHVDSFARSSVNEYSFCHANERSHVDFALEVFDAVAIHYSVRLPYDQISPNLAQKLEVYDGLKFLFIQDEYDFTDRAGDWIRRLGMRLVFTVVPPSNISIVYPPSQFTGVRFVSNLTGYVPEELPQIENISLPSKRLTVVGYRGRPLPLRYGQLGFEKVEIGRQVKEFCVRRRIRHDIAWAEEDRIYGAGWYEFMASCRGMLGSESGSNVFDRDGSLGAKELAYRQAHPRSTDAMVYEDVMRSHEFPGLMNQVSPRIFEAIALRTALVLYEGHYSGVVRADEHFIALRKDGKNLADVLRQLQDDTIVDRLTKNAARDVIESGKYAYAGFVGMVDQELALSAAWIRPIAAQKREFQQFQLVDDKSESDGTSGHHLSSLPTRRPIKTVLPSKPHSLLVLFIRIAHGAWNLLPRFAKDMVKPILKKVLGRD